MEEVPQQPAEQSTETTPVELPMTPNPAPASTEPASPVQPTSPAQPAPVSQVNIGFAMGDAATSTGPNGQFPEELRRWNWGAFFGSWLWAIANNVYVGLLALIPPLHLIISIVLGMKGNEWAWKHRRFESIDQFRAVQRAWTRWGVGIFIAMIVLIILGFSLLFHAASTSGQSDDTTRKADVASIARDVTTYAKDPINKGLLPLSLDSLGKHEPTDPLSGASYEYNVDDNLLKGQVCATLSDYKTYCVDVKSPDTATTPEPTANPL